MSGYPDVITFAVALVDDLKPGTGLAGVPIFGRRQEPGIAPPFVLLEPAGALRPERMPLLAPARVQARCFALTDEEADALYRALSDLLHERGPAVRGDIGLYRAYDETGPQPTQDPDIGWAISFGIFDLYMTDRTIAVA